MKKLIACICLWVAFCANICCARPAGRADGGESAAAAAAAPPGLGQGRRIEPGVLFHEVKLPGQAGAAASKLWVYLPEGQTRPKIPCVLIAPAGTRLFHGITLGEGDRPEHLPYVRAGFAVVAYELDGSPSDESDEALVSAARLFKKAEAGLVNARAALDYALANVPQIDPARIYTAGHSSAATTSLLVARREPRVRACVAYAPVTDVEKYFGEDIMEALSSVMPDYREFVRRTSPQAGARDLRCPLFLFHAEDDENVRIAESVKFAGEVGRHNPSVTFVRAAKGGHYDAMVKEGIPKAVEWLKALS